MTTSDLKDSNSKDNSQTEDSVNSTTKGSASAKKTSGRPDFVYDVRERESFYRDLQTFHESRNTPIVRFPKVNGREVDLHKLYAEVVKRGGWLKVNIRNEWDELLHVLGIKQKCVNATVAIKHIYTRYLDKYERLHFLGEDPDRVDEPDDEGSRHKKWSTKTFTSVAMTYNHSQHQVAEPQRLLHRLSTDMYKPTEYDKLMLSLLSPLPNEQDFAINVCTLMANESQHTLKLDHCPKLVEVLIAHAGVFGHFTTRNLFTEMYTKIRRHSLQTFWTDCLYDKPPILELSYDDYCQAPDETFADLASFRSCQRVLGTTDGGKIVDPEEYKNDVAKYDFLCLGRGLGTHDYVGQRVHQVTSIMRNLSFFEENLPILSTNRTFLRFLVMCSNIRWGNLHHMAFDIFGNIATLVTLRDPKSDELTRCILSTLCEGLEGQDRGVIISCLEILNKLSQKDANAQSLNQSLDFKTYKQICLFLALNDIMLLLYTLECLYGLSSLGSRPCNSIIQVKGVVDTLVSLITVEAQSYGPDGCILMRVVETVPGNMLPMVAQNIANLQNVAMQGHVLAAKKESLSEAVHAVAVANSEAQKSLVANQASSTPIRAVVAQTTKEMMPSPQTPVVAKSVTSVQEGDPFALAWVTATFEAAATQNSRVEQQELYKMYLAACQKAGRRGQVSPIHFPQIVRTVLGVNVGPSLMKTTEANGVELNAFYYVNIRVRANPMPVQYKAPTIQLHQTPNQVSVQKIVTKSQPASPTIPQAQVKIIQSPPPDSTSNRNPDVILKGKTPKKSGHPQPIQTSDILTQPPLQQPAQTQQQISNVPQQQPQIVTQLQENQLVAGKHVIISHSVTAQPVIQKSTSQPNQSMGESNQTSVIQQSPHQQAQIQIQQVQMSQQTHMSPQHIQIQQQQIQFQPQQQQQQSQPMQIVQQQVHLQQTNAQQVQHQLQQQQLVQAIQNANNAAMVQGNGSIPQTSSSLIKSLLANKVTTSPTATSDVNEANASAAANNPSCLITQNVNLHQVVQRQQMKQKELAQQQLQQQQLQQQQSVQHATISSLVNNPIIPTNAVKVGQTTIKAITSNAVLPASVIEKKPTQPLAPPQNPPANMETTESSGSQWDPVPPLAPLSGNMQMQNVKIHSNVLIPPGNDDSNSTGNNSVASSAISSTQIVTTDDGEGSLISFEDLLIPKSKSDSSSVTEDDASKDSFNRNTQIFQGNQMLMDLLDKKSPEPPAPSSGMKRKYDDESITEESIQKRIAVDNSQEDVDEEDMPMVQASKTAANLYAEMAAKLLEDEDFDDEPEVVSTIPVIQPPVEQKQVISMPVPIQRQIIMGPNNQVILTQPSQPVNQAAPPQATATIKTDSGLQTVPLIIQKQIGPNGQQIIQPVLQQQQPPQTQYMLATNPQGQTYLVAQQQPSQQSINPALLLAQAGQQQGSQTKTIIILQQQGGPPQAVAQQQIISNPAGQQKVIMTTQQGQQMIVTQVPRPIHHQIIVNNPNSNMMPNGSSQNVILSQNAPLVQQQSSMHQQQSHASQAQIQMHQSHGGQPQIQIQTASGQQQVQLQGPITSQQIQFQSAAVPQAQIQVQPGNVAQQQQIQSVIQKHMPSQIGGNQIQLQQTASQGHTSQHSITIQNPIMQQNQSALQVQNSQQQIAAQQQAAMLSQLPQIPATIKIHTSSLPNQAQQQMHVTPQKVPVKPQLVAPVQQSVIQATQSRPDQKRQIIMTGTGPIELTENPKRVATPTPVQPVNVAQSNSQHVAQVSAATQQHMPQTVQQSAPQQQQQPIQQQPGPPQPQPSQQSPLGRISNKSNSEASATEDDGFDQNWLWICDWRGCPRRQYKSLAEVYRHACTVHCPESLDPAAEIYCQWGPGSGLCDNIPRKRYSLMTHLLDRHCTAESFKAAVQRRLTTGVQPPTHGQPVTIIKNVPTNSSETRGTASPALSTSSSSSLPPAASAAMHAIKRHSNDFVNPKELMDENEGPVTKSIRLTAALILRNLVTHTSLAKRNVRCYEPHLAGVALSNVESSRTISQILYELNN